MTSPISDLIARAKQTPLSRPAVEEMAKAGGFDGSIVQAALDAGEAHAATVLAFACAAAKAPLETTTTAALLADLENPEYVGPLAQTAKDGAAAALLQFLEGGRGTLDREADALLVLSAASLSPVPVVALRHARKLCRRAISPEASVALGGAAVRFQDKSLLTLAAEDVKRASRQKRGVEELIAAQQRAPLEVLGATGAPRVVAGYTVRKEAAVGRNDTCPCGSGKKFKKCCALKEETAVVSTPKVEVKTLHPEQVMDMRRAEMLGLDTSQLTNKAWYAAFRRYLTLREWDRAEAMLSQGLSKGETAKSLVTLHVLLFQSAALAGNREVAERVFAKLPDDEKAFEELGLALVRKDADLLNRIEESAVEALRDETNGAAAIELAYALLHTLPGIGIFVARGAMHEGRVNDCQTLIDEMEDARDRLLLAPIEPWWDFYDNMIEAADDRDERIAKTAEQQKLAKDLRKARDEKRRATAELTKLREKLEDLDVRAAEAAPAPAPKSAKGAKNEAPTAAPSAPSAISAEIEEERRRLRTKVAELKRIVDEGQEERRELRKRLMEVATENDDDGERDEIVDANARREAEDDARERAMEEEGDLDAPRNVLVPRFSDRAAKALRDLDAVAELVLSLVAGLAAGKENAWSGTKQLKKVRGVISARAGIYHRVLFRVQDGMLEVLEVIPRKELEVTVTRLAAMR